MRKLYIICINNRFIFITSDNLRSYFQMSGSIKNFSISKLCFCSKQTKDRFIRDSTIQEEARCVILNEEIENFLQKIAFFKNMINFQNFNEKITQFYHDDLWDLVKIPFVGYVIKKAYIASHIRRNQKTQEFSGKTEFKLIDEHDFITLKTLATNSHIINRCYNLKTGEIVIIKFNGNDGKSFELFHREKQLYESLKIHHSYRPKCFGSVRKDDGLVLEFIEGEELEKSDMRTFSIAEKISIIFNVMISIEDVHLNFFLYRDLKPTNIIIDSNKKAVLIDFDYSRIEENNDQKTSGFGELGFLSPELDSSNNYSFQTDIYSIGKIIYFIIHGKKLLNDNEFEKFPIEFECLEEIYKQCTEEDPLKRPNISELINTFYDYCTKEIFHDEKIRIVNDLVSIRLKQIQNFVVFDDFDVKKQLIDKIVLLFDFLSKLNDNKLEDFFREFFPEIVNFASLCDLDCKSLFIIGKLYYEEKLVAKNIERAFVFLDLSKRKNEQMFLHLAKQHKISLEQIQEEKIRPYQKKQREEKQKEEKQKNQHQEQQTTTNVNFHINQNDSNSIILPNEFSPFPSKSPFFTQNKPSQHENIYQIIKQNNYQTRDKDHNFPSEYSSLFIQSPFYSSPKTGENQILKKINKEPVQDQNKEKPNLTQEFKGKNRLPPEFSQMNFQAPFPLANKTFLSPTPFSYDSNK